MVMKGTVSPLSTYVTKIVKGGKFLMYGMFPSLLFQSNALKGYM